MIYSAEVLTNSWTFTNGHLEGAALVLDANGSATQVIIAPEIANMPESLLLVLSATRYADRYVPTDFVVLDIVYNDLSAARISVPLAAYTVIPTKTAVVESFTIRIVVNQATTISAISLKAPSGDGLQENTSYYGVTISRSTGLHITKSDESSEVVLNSDTLTMRAKVDGVMTDKIYFDPVEGNYVFDGKLSADAISAIVVDTPNLYAGKANISELTVDQLDTSDKVQKYLAEDATDDNFQRIFDQYHEFITAQTDGLEANKVQATNRDNEDLYWTDETYTAATTDVTAFPVYTYSYTETTKLQIGFDLEPSGGNYIPMISLGAGVGGDYPEMGKGFIYKGTDGLYLDYYSSINNALRRVALTDDGIVITPMALESLDFYDNGFVAEYTNEIVSMLWEKDLSGKITKLITEDNVEIPVNWHAGDM